MKKYSKILGVILLAAALGYGASSLRSDSSKIVNLFPSIRMDDNLGIGIDPLTSTRLLLPTENDVATPTLAFGNGDTGFYESDDNTIRVSNGGVNSFIFSNAGDSFSGKIAGSASIRNEATSATNPTLIPNRSDISTGIGSAGTSQLSLITGTLEGLKVNNGIASIRTGGNGFAYTMGRVSVNTTAVGTDADTLEKDLMTFTLPGSSMDANGRSVRITAWGSTAANANTKTIKLYFGAGTIQNSGSIVLNNEGWVIVSTVVRTGASAQKANSTGMYGSTSYFATLSNQAEDILTPIIIKVTGQNGTASANDIVAEGMLVEFIN